MKNVLYVYKPLGWTSLQVITELKRQKPELRAQTISYAGRLDPMAEGLLLLLIGEENKKRKNYENLEKTYEVEFFLGVATDSYDILGKVTEYSSSPTHMSEKVNILLPSFVGTFTQPFPPYSSYKIKRKPLFYYAKNNLLSTITIRTKERKIYSIGFLGTKKVKKETLEQSIYQRINLVTGNFRQEEIKKSWRQYFEASHQESYDIVQIKVSCSSGTYMRSLVSAIGQMLHTQAVTYCITRTRIGTFKEEDALFLSQTKKA